MSRIKALSVTMFIVTVTASFPRRQKSIHLFRRQTGTILTIMVEQALGRMLIHAHSATVIHRIPGARKAHRPMRAMLSVITTRMYSAASVRFSSLRVRRALVPYMAIRQRQPPLTAISVTTTPSGHHTTINAVSVQAAIQHPEKG